MKEITRITVGIVAIVLLVGTLYPNDSNAGSQIVCPTHSNFNHNPSNGSFALSWGLGVGGTSVVFLPTKLVLGGNMGQLSREHLEFWRPIIEELRAASEKRARIQIFFNDQTKEITALQALYYQPC